MPDQSLKERYNAEWAVVTGGSSGIGLSIVERLASEGINVVIVALDDSHFESSLEYLKEKYQSVKFMPIPLDLSNNQIDALIDGTKDIKVSLVFNNAGYVKPGFFVNHPLPSIMANYNVNATCCLAITHHFATKLIDEKRSGLICFTSSSGGFLPSPLASIYSSTKAFMTNFGVALAGELSKDDIDVLVVHPSPIATNFYQNAAGMSMLLNAAKAAQSPDVIADVIWRNAGRFVVVDQGIITCLLKVFLKIIDWNVIGELMPRILPLTPDFKRFSIKNKK